MKKKFEDRKIGKLLKSKGAKKIGSFISGALGVYLKPLAGGIVGLSEGIKQVKADNLNSEIGGKGKINYVNLIGMVASLGLMFAYAMDWISIEKFNFIFDILQSVLD